MLTKSGNPRGTITDLQMMKIFAMLREQGLTKDEGDKKAGEMFSGKRISGLSIGETVDFINYLNGEEPMEPNKFEMNEGDFMLFLEPKTYQSKKTGQPFDGYSGKAMINGVEMSIFAFKNEKEGKKAYFKGSIKPREAKPVAEVPRQTANLGEDTTPIDQIPFWYVLHRASKL